MTLRATRPVVARELAGGAAVFTLYLLADTLTGAGRQQAAQRNGAALLRVEQALHVPAEAWLNRGLSPHQALRVVANYEYAFTYVVSAAWLLVWLYRRRPETYRWARSSFLAVNVVAVATFAVYPVTPPRLLAGAGFVDTVSADGTWGTWGSPIAARANQVAAMPSLHLAWALWVSVVLAVTYSRWWVQVLSGLHVSVTMVVIMATGNHYLLDAVGGAVTVWLAVVVVGVVQDRPGRFAGPRVAAADAFFLYVETVAAPQHVGGMVVLTGPAEGFTDRLRDTVRAHLDVLPRFRQRLSPPGRWRRPRWLPAAEPDWGWHVPGRDLTTVDGYFGGMAALHELVAEIQATPLPRDRPLWRFVAVTGFAPGQVAAILVVHHAVADGIGTIAQAVKMLEPVPLWGSPPSTGPGSLRRAVATAVGLAQLAADGPSRHRLATTSSAGRRFGTLAVPLEPLQAAARGRQVRLTDVLLTAVAGGLARTLPAGRPETVRTAVPLAMRVPDSSAEGNVTSAVMVDLPLTGQSEVDRLAVVGRRSRRLRTGTRALGGRFVMSSGCAVLPPPVLAWFARTVYGRRFFQAIVSNMPGPTGSYRLAGASIEEVYPVLPLAPGAPLAVGVIGWDGVLFLGVSVDPALVPDADRLTAAVRDALDELTGRGERWLSLRRPVTRPPSDPAASDSLDALPPDALPLDPLPLDTMALDPLPLDPLPLEPVTADRLPSVRLASDRLGIDFPEVAALDGRLHANANTSRDRLSGESNVDPNNA